MQINGVDRCLACFGVRGAAAACPHCGREQGDLQRPPPYLPYGFRLNGQYLLGRVLGHGGFGITYLAWDQRLDTRVAIKEYLPRDFCSRGTDGLSVSCFEGQARPMYDHGLRRFLDEARTLARFAEHPGIVTVLSYFEGHATAYMVMQYVDGLDLRQYLARQGGRLRLELALKILDPVLQALRAIHKERILHRDVSLDNIYLTRSGRVLLLDFGAARETMGSQGRTRALIRKAGYSPEEQYRTTGQQGPWTDVYAVSATLYRVLTGQNPPPAVERLGDDRLLPPSRLGVAIDPKREQALLRGLAVRAEDRFQDIGSLQAALDVSASTTAQGGRIAAPRHDRPAINPADAVLPVAILALAVGLWIAGQRDEGQPTATEASDRRERPPVNGPVVSGAAHGADPQAAPAAAAALASTTQPASRATPASATSPTVAPASRPPRSAPAPASTTSISLRLSQADRAQIGQRIWRNEVGGNPSNLIVWNPGEDHASVGIGHFIWYPRARTGAHTETFPTLLRWVQAAGHPLPGWLREQPDCPWDHPAALARAKRLGTPRYHELQRLLTETIPIQTAFMIERLVTAMPRMLATVPAQEQRDHIERQFHRVLGDRRGGASPRGAYALIDYVNFKGEGVNPAERYRGQGWGLLQVLAQMQGDGGDPVAELAAAAEAVLEQRIANAPAHRNEARWRQGWRSRLRTYTEPAGNAH